MNIYEHNGAFLTNKYTTWYYNIIELAIKKRKVPVDGEYYESHHILPKSIFPKYKSNKSNLVYLTPKEHFICHLLLTKMTYGRNRYKMSKALTMLMHIKQIGDRSKYSINSRWYDYQRRLAHTVKTDYWTAERRRLQSIKLTAYNSEVDKTSDEYLSRNAAIQYYQLYEKVWTDRAIQTRLQNCLTAAANRKGKPWSENRRMSHVPRKQTDSSNEKRRIKMKGRKTSDGMLGHNHTDASKQKCSNSNRGLIVIKRGYWYESPQGAQILFCPIVETANLYNLSLEQLRLLRLGKLKKNHHRGWRFIRTATADEISPIKELYLNNFHQKKK